MTTVRVTLNNDDCTTPLEILESVERATEWQRLNEGHLLAELASCGVPVRHSVGHELLSNAAEAVISDWAENAKMIVLDYQNDPTEWDYIAFCIAELDMTETVQGLQDLETSAGKIPHATHDIWKAFIDLDAMAEDVELTKVVENPEGRFRDPVTVAAFDNLTEVAVGALCLILDRMGYALVRQMNEEAAQAIEDLSAEWSKANDTEGDEVCAS